MIGKAEARKDALKMLRVCDFPSASRVKDIVCARQAYQKASDLFGYYPLSTEIDVTSVLDQALADGKRVWLPVCVGAHLMEFRRIDGPDWRDSLVRASNGTMCPTDGETAGLGVLGRTLVMVPGLAFDSLNHRLGRGGGYYDAYLSAIRDDGRFWRMGVCLPFQSIDFAYEAHDVPLDEVLML